jgi:LacI family transcriptional regulator
MITHKKVAEHLGISPKTVANILSSSAGYRYSEETRKRVLEAAEQLGYRRNRLSRSLRRGRSNLIGIINFGASAEIAQKVQSKLPCVINAEGFDYLSVDLNWHGGDVERVIDEMIQARVEGVVISHMVETFGSHYTEMLARAGIPAVTIYGSEKLNIPLIADDARSAYYAMTRHLQSVGHRRLMLLTGISDSRPPITRVEGFRLAMQDFAETKAFHEADFFASNRLPWGGVNGGIILHLDISRFGYLNTFAFHHAAKRIFAMDAPPNAILCFNDQGALGVFTAAFEAGLRVPADIAITGGDNDLFGEFPLYALTTVEKDLEGACAAAVELLIARIRKQKTVVENRIFPSTLVLRKSCGRTILPNEPAVQFQPIPALLEYHTKQQLLKQ